MPDAISPSAPIKPSYIVGLGASAGGLAALEKFFDAMSPDSGMAFVVVQHLSPDFKSLMDDLLARHTTMPIHRVESGLALVANAIYLIPPKMLMTVAQGKLYLQERDVAQHLELPIDIFFRSLANDAQERAIGIILSGSGSDGSRGIQTIHEAGGLVLAQTVETAQFDGMPRSAFSTGICDYVVAPEEMPVLLLEYAHDPETVRQQLPSPLQVVAEEGEYAEIFALLRRGYGLDFAKYKATTVGRRILRRMEFQQIPTVKDYSTLLAADPSELDALYKDLLIGVTEFFRDPKAFACLETDVIPELFQNVTEEGLRVWVAGCATGEEAYSLGILLREEADRRGFDGKITIFATDVHRTSLEIASVGTYEAGRLKNVSASRLEEHFLLDSEGRHKISADLRKLVVFAPHNLTNDPPFTKMDLVCCRNLLIYLQPDTQEKIISLFTFSLRVGGVLFLGSSEGLGKFADEFAVVSAPYKLFRKLRDLKLALDFKGVGLTPRPGPTAIWQPGPKSTVALDRQILHDYDSLLKRHLPPGVLINEQRQVLHYFSSIANYLKPPEGRAESDLLRMVEGDLQLALSMALQRASKSGASVTLPNVRARAGVEETRVDIVVDCLTDEKTHTNHYHVSFVEPRTPEPPPPADMRQPIPATAFDFDTVHALQTRVSDLELELQSTKENLQATVEELQTSNEELQATNEELLAANEELQSTNEELHSVNEELYTVNAEFEKKNRELQQLNGDHENLLASLEVGVVFLDDQLRIRKFNPASAYSFKLLPQDIGRPIDHIAYHLTGQDQMLHDIQQVLLTGEVIEAEVQIQTGGWLLQRLVPFRSDSPQVDGVVLTFTNISSIKAAELEIKALNAELEQKVALRTRELAETNECLMLEIQEHERDEATLQKTQEQLELSLAGGNAAWWIWDYATGQVTCDRRKAEMIGYRPEEFPKSVYDICKLIHPDDYESTMEAMRDHLTGKTDRYEVEYRMRTKSGDFRWLNDRGNVAEWDSAGRPGRITGVVLDITARKQIEADFRASEAKYRTLFETMVQGVVYQGADGRIISANPAAEKILGLTLDQMQGRTSLDPRWKAVHEDGADFPGEAHPAMMALQTGQAIHNITMGVFNPQMNAYTWINVNATPQFQPGESQPYQVYATFEDITARKEMEAQLKASLAEKELMLREIHHRVKNNLQIISSLMGLQAQYIQDPATLAVFQESQDRVRSMALVHEKLYQSGDLAHIDLEMYLEELVGYLLQVVHPQNRLSWAVQAPDISLPVDIAIPCGLIVNELVSNALKHAFPDQREGVLRVTMTCMPGADTGDGQHFTLVVSDNGIGLPPALDWRTSSTLGLRLVSMLSKQLHGVVELHAVPGTTFAITFPDRRRA